MAGQFVSKLTRLAMIMGMAVLIPLSLLQFASPALSAPGAGEFAATLSPAQKKLFELFPYGYVKQACKIAGMRRPRAWSTG